MAAAPEGGEVAARNVRPRVVAVPHWLAFLERWRPFVQAQIYVPRRIEYVLTPYGFGALFTIDNALMNMASVADESNVNQVEVLVTLSIPELHVKSRRTLDLRWDADAGQWYTRPIRPAEAELPALPWTALTGGDDLLEGLRFQADELLLEVWARRRLAEQALVETLPADLLQFEIAPFISYARQGRELTTRRRRQSRGCDSGLLCSPAAVDAYAKQIGW